MTQSKDIKWRQGRHASLLLLVLPWTFAGSSEGSVPFTKSSFQVPAIPTKVRKQEGGLGLPVCVSTTKSIDPSASDLWFSNWRMHQNQLEDALKDAGSWF
jgi:hypothetical protein